MASSVQFENTYPEDERWLEAGADAFALHFAACCYADRKNTDGLIPKVMVPRIVSPVAPEAVDAAVAALLAAGFWRSAGKSYQVVNYLEDKIGLPADEKLSNRERWAADKRWRRRHNAGNHADCPPDKCRKSGKVSQSDNGETLDGLLEDSSRTTRPDSTRPDSTRPDHGVGGATKSGPRSNGPASAGATASPERRGYGGTPRQLSDGSWVTAEQLGWVDPFTLTEAECDRLSEAYWQARMDELEQTG